MTLYDWFGILGKKMYLKCGYLPQKKTEEVFLRLEKPSLAWTTSLLENGFRRYGRIFYRSECPECRHCMSYRVLVEKFSLTKYFKRVLKRNQDLRFEWSIPKFTISKAKLYLKYIWEKHRDFQGTSSFVKKKHWIREQLNVLLEHLYTPIQGTLELTVYLNALLIGFAIFDSTPQALSAVYSVYDTDYKKRSLGTAIILEGWRYALRNRIPYYYLGYYIPDSQKMNYKKKFSPAEILNPFTKKWEDADKVEKEILEVMGERKSMGEKAVAHG